MTTPIPTTGTIVIDGVSHGVHSDVAKAFTAMREVLENARTSIFIMQMPVEGDPAEVASNCDLLKIMDASFIAALKKAGA